MTTERQATTAAAAGRHALTAAHFAGLSELSNYWILTMDRVVSRRIPAVAGERVYVLVFRECDEQGRPYDMRLSASDIRTLQRIYGRSQEWPGQWCVTERRTQGKAGDGFGNGQAFVRVARPAKWRGLVGEAVPSTEGLREFFNSARV